MTTPEKKTPEKEPVKVTSGKDTAAFVAAKPAAAEEKPIEEPKNLGPSDEELAAHKKHMDDLEKDFRERKAKLEAEERDQAEAAKLRRDEEMKKHEEAMANLREQQKQANTVFRTQDGFEEDEEVDHPTNSRGRPIPVEEGARQGVRHISEVGGDNYNGKSDTIED